MKPASRHTVVSLTLEALTKISNDKIVNSFKEFALNLKSDGNGDLPIHCFKEGQPCAKGLAA